MQESEFEEASGTDESTVETAEAVTAEEVVAEVEETKPATKSSSKKSISKGSIEMTFHGKAIEEDAAKVKKDTRTKVVGTLEKPTHFVVDDGNDKSIVWLNLDIKCTIGPTRYHFKKDEKYRVSKDVKDVLVARGALKAL